MKLISHRGNIKGSKPEYENSPNYISQALKLGYEVEVDVRFHKGFFYLGHDKPQYRISSKFLRNKKIWCHAKDINAFEKLKKIKSVYFWHQKDDYTLTSNGYFWTYPGKKILKNSICVSIGKKKKKNLKCAGICSDYISIYKND
jgi:hypothetical protein